MLRLSLIYCIILPFLFSMIMESRSHNQRTLWVFCCTIRNNIPLVGNTKLLDGRDLRAVLQGLKWKNRIQWKSGRIIIDNVSLPELLVEEDNFS